ncbi:MAG: hypothetical protein GC155_16570 [Alphaproteobacteria bacterium]|nr:hypothetical protein [Alphaproteobacteria bacterium]
MTASLNELLARLATAPLERSLDGVPAGVAQGIARARAAATQTWGLRAAAMLLVVVSGVAASGSLQASASINRSPFAAWSELAPSTLLQFGG